MPLLLQILFSANDESHRTLRAKSIEAISLVGMAVGRELFRADAQHVMSFLAQLQRSDGDDELQTYILQVNG